MSLTTVSITLPDDLLVQMDQYAGSDAESRDIFVQNAVKMFIDKQNESQNHAEDVEKVVSTSKSYKNDVLEKLKAYKSEGEVIVNRAFSLRRGS
jgi:metal-responsive CopG/Arc/MetJ family transcriptional regulator